MGLLARAVCFSTHDEESPESQERFGTVGGQEAVQRLPPECAIVGSGDGEVRLHETGELEECASSRPATLLSVMRKHVRALCVSVLVVQPERPAITKSVP